MHATTFFKLTFLSTAALLGGIRGAWAEKHTITFDNQCGRGTPQLIQQGKILSSGEAFTSNGPFVSGIAYLQTGSCLLNGEGCSLVEMTLVNPTCPGCGSSTDISLIPPHAFSVPVSFSYSGGCAGQGATCTSAACKTAFFVPDDNQVQVECQDADVDLVVTFCPSASIGGSSPPKASSSSTKPTISTPTIISSTSTQVKATSTATESVPSLPNSTPISANTDANVNANAPKCARSSNGRRRRSVSSDSEHTMSRHRGATRMARARGHHGGRETF